MAPAFSSTWATVLKPGIGTSPLLPSRRVRISASVAMKFSRMSFPETVTDDESSYDYRMFGYGRVSGKRWRLSGGFWLFVGDAGHHQAYLLSCCFFARQLAHDAPFVDDGDAV